MNNWNFTGNLGADAEQRVTPSGEPVVSFSVGVKAGFGDRATTTGARCQMWGKRGESVAPYLRNLIVLSGALREKYTETALEREVALRMLLVSDIHAANLYPLMRTIVEDERIDVVVDAGDIVNFGSPAELDASLKNREATIAEQQSVQQAELIDRQRQLTAKQAELETRLEAEFAQRREAYAAQLETKLGDAVTAFLTDTLGQQADLGAQMPYLLSQLESHKADLIREVKGDV